MKHQIFKTENMGIKVNMENIILGSCTKAGVMIHNGDKTEVGEKPG